MSLGRCDDCGTDGVDLGWAQVCRPCWEAYHANPVAYMQSLVNEQRTRIEAVRSLHQQYRSPWTDITDICTECSRHGGPMEITPWPCPTVKALEPESSELVRTYRETKQ